MVRYSFNNLKNVVYLKYNTNEEKQDEICNYPPPTL
jgi:hypothetical protein